MDKFLRSSLVNIGVTTVHPTGRFAKGEMQQYIRAMGIFLLIACGFGVGAAFGWTFGYHAGYTAGGNLLRRVPPDEN
jgi:hypothetical protein